MLARVFVRQNARPCSVQPRIAAGVIEVPVRVYQLLDGVRVDVCQRHGKVRPRRDNFAIDQQLSVRAGQNGNVSTRTQKNGDVATKRLQRNFRRGGFLKRTWNEIVFLRKQSLGRKASRRNRETSRSEEMPAREFSRCSDGHVLLLF